MDLRHGRCPSCEHGEVVETQPYVRVERENLELFAASGVPLELWTCTRCGRAQLTVAEPSKLLANDRARRVRAEPPPGTFDVRIVHEVPTDGALRVSLETKLARLLGIDYRQAARLLDGPLPIVLAKGLDWNAAEHARALLARMDVTIKVAPAQPAGYR